MSEDEATTVDISGLFKHFLLAELFNQAVSPSGDARKMSQQEAKGVLRRSGPQIAEHEGRVLHVNLEGELLDTRGYDAHNGKGVAQEIVKQVRRNPAAKNTVPPNSRVPGPPPWERGRLIRQPHRRQSP